MGSALAREAEEADLLVLLCGSSSGTIELYRYFVRHGPHYLDCTSTVPIRKQSAQSHSTAKEPRRSTRSCLFTFESQAPSLEWQYRLFE
jgi:hypothetical protein